MYTVRWQEFIKICKPGVIASVIAALVFGVSVSIHHFKVEDWNKGIGAQQNERRLQAWTSRSRRTQAYNDFVLAYRNRDPEKALARGESEYYIRFVLALEQAQTPEQRETAYLRYRGLQRLPESMTLSAYRSITDPSLSIQERLHRIHPERSDASNLAVATANHLQGRHELRPMPPRPQPIIARMKPGLLLAMGLGAMALAQASMSVSYLVLGRKRWEDGKKRWAVPVNIGSWLMMLLYAPAFVIPWILRLMAAAIVYGLLIPGAWFLNRLVWLLTEADVPAFLAYATQRRRARLEEQRKQLEEIAAVGQDVINLRLELVRAKQEAAQIKDPQKRAERIHAIEIAEQQLAEVSKSRSNARTRVDLNSMTEETSDEQEHAEVLLQIAALHEAERVR